MGNAPLVWSARVPADPTSPRRCRQATTDLLGRAGADHLASDAALLVSELVTNVLLHVRSEASVRVSVRTGTLLVEVEDESPVLPRPLVASDSSPTGRGLALVQGLANAWGAVPNGEGGKVIWFELGADTTTRSRVRSPEPLEAPITISLLGAPVALALSALAHGDAMLRELALARFAEPATTSPPTRHPDVDIAPLRRALTAAHEQGLATSDVEVAFDGAAAMGVLHRLALVDEGDRIGREGGTLAAPSLPEVAMCRTWMLTEVAWQLKGAEPTRWHLPAPVDTSAGWEPASDLDVGDAGVVGAAVVLADGQNRILHLNDEAEDLLGWTSAELAGRRLTLLIPPAIHQAHLAAFTRHQVTGERTIIGTEVVVPALAKSGIEVDILLTVDEIVLASGAGAFRGTMRRPA